MRWRIALPLLLVWPLVVSHSGLAQLPRPGDRDPQGRILLKVSAKSGGSTRDAIPISGVSLFVVSENGVPQALVTNDAGYATVWLIPAPYRVVSRAPTMIGGRAYTWDVIVEVRAGAAQVTLTEANATQVALVQAPNPTLASGKVVRSDRSAGGSFWTSGSLAYGAMTCDGCDSFVGGPSVSVVAGMSISPAFLLGVAGTGWTRSQDGVTVTIAAVDALVRYYPAHNRRLFLTAGAGATRLTGRLAGDARRSESGPSGFLGVGFDVPMGERLSLTPSWTAMLAKTSNADARVSQLGVGLTVK